MVQKKTIQSQSSDPNPSTGAAITLFPVYMGSTDKLLNADHEEGYFKDMPKHSGRVKQFSS